MDGTWNYLVYNVLYITFFKVENAFVCTGTPGEKYNRLLYSLIFVQVIFFQKHLFLYQLTHNMRTDCSLNSRLQYMKIPSSEHVENILLYKLF